MYAGRYYGMAEMDKVAPRSGCNRVRYNAIQCDAMRRDENGARCDGRALIRWLEIRLDEIGRDEMNVIERDRTE